MKDRLILFFKTYFLFVLIFIIMKPLFMLYHHALYHTVSFVDYLQVICHGFTMDLSVAGYLTVIPAIILIISSFSNRPFIKKIFIGYFVIISLLLSFIYVVDMVLYSFWGFRLDNTPIYYFMTSPKDAIASVSFWYSLSGFVCLALVAFLLYLLFYYVLIKRRIPMKIPFHNYAAAFILFILTLALFIPIRGGFTTSTMNTGRVYYSSNQQLNHAAINPCFSFLNSFVHEMDTRGQYRFFKEEEANRLFAQMIDTSDGGPDVTQVLSSRRPNVIVVILESFSCKLMQTMGGVPNVAVNMDKFGQEGILFTNFMANSFRTDRGVAAILAAYPAQPTTSIMKYPRKTEQLPMFPKVMKTAGYDLKYYYGGDADFTNMRSFLVNAGFVNIVSDKDFPLSERLSKWGAPDGPVFNRAYADIKNNPKQPFLKIVQTSSSHEPYDVPNFYRLKDKRLNAFAYADSCLGAFVNKLRTLPAWKNTLIVLVPDHLGVYPPDIDNYSFERYHIPLIMLGGAIRQPMTVPVYGSQIDIAATLLSQLGLSHKVFTFSKDLFNPKSPHFGYSTFPNACCMVTPDDSVFFNCESNKVLSDKGKKRSKNLPYAKAYLQKLFDDLSKR